MEITKDYSTRTVAVEFSFRTKELLSLGLFYIQKSKFWKPNKTGEQQ